MLHRRSALHQLAVGALALLLPGCATLPEYREDAVTTAEVILNIKCELVRAVYDIEQHAWARDWNADVIVNFLIDQSGSVDVDAGFTFPLAHGASFVAGLTTGFSGAANRTERISFKQTLVKMHEIKAQCEDTSQTRFARLGGKLGIDDLFARASKSKDIAKIDPKQLNYDLEFKIRKSASATPRFNMVPLASEKFFGGDVRSAAERSDTHRLQITLLPPDKPCPVAEIRGKCPDIVHIVGINQGLTARHSGGKTVSGWMPEAVEKAPGKTKQSGRKRRVSTGSSRSPSASPSSSGMSAAEERALDAAASRNILQGINDRLPSDIR